MTAGSRGTGGNRLMMSSINSPTSVLVALVKTVAVRQQCKKGSTAQLETRILKCGVPIWTPAESASDRLTPVSGRRRLRQHHVHAKIRDAVHHPQGVSKCPSLVAARCVAPNARAPRFA